MYSPLLFSINIEYDYSFDKNTTKLVFHFFGYDRWDFEKMEAKWYEIKKHLYNLYEEICASKFAGDRTPFNIYYNFHWSIDFNENGFWDSFMNGLKGE